MYSRLAVFGVPTSQPKHDLRISKTKNLASSYNTNPSTTGLTASEFPLMMAKGQSSCPTLPTWAFPLTPASYLTISISSLSRPKISISLHLRRPGGTAKAEAQGAGVTVSKAPRNKAVAVGAGSSSRSLLSFWSPVEAMWAITLIEQSNDESTEASRERRIQKVLSILSSRLNLHQKHTKI